MEDSCSIIKSSKFFQNRSDFQCQHRWQKVLNPELIKGPWTKEEDQRVIMFIFFFFPQSVGKLAFFLPSTLFWRINYTSKLLWFCSLGAVCIGIVSCVLKCSFKWIESNQVYVEWIIHVEFLRVWFVGVKNTSSLAPCLELRLVKFRV